MIEETDKQSAYIQFYIEIDEIIGYLPAESTNEIHDIYLKYLELHKQELANAFEKGYEEGVNYTDGLISEEKRFPF